MTKREILADSLLLLTALIWGCAFAVVKNALDSFPPGAIIAMRYLIAAAITGILLPGRSIRPCPGSDCGEMRNRPSPGTSYR